MLPGQAAQMAPGAIGGMIGIPVAGAALNMVLGK